LDGFIISMVEAVCCAPAIKIRSSPVIKLQGMPAATSRSRISIASSRNGAR